MTLTAQEQATMQNLLAQVTQAPLQTPSPQANALIQQALGNRPDATYLLLQFLAFKDAQMQQIQQQMMQMQQQMMQMQQGMQQQQPQRSSGFGSFFGGGRPAQPQQQPFGGSPFGGAPTGGGFGSSFLGNVATTAVGVAAGSALFSGLGSLFGGGGEEDGGGDSGE